MLLTISTTHDPATDLGFLLHKNPARAHTTELPFGRAHVVFTEATPERCTAALLVEVDPVGLVRGRKGPKGSGASLAQYVNDRPYATSSFLSVALGRMLGTALAGRSKERPDLVDAPIPITVRLPVVACRGGEPILRRLFEPLGYRVEATAIPLDPTFPGWGDSQYLDVTLSASRPIREILEHLFVLLPVLDDDKHYWVGADEVDKLVRRGGAWLGEHPDQELIARRYLRHDRRLTLDALARLLSDEPADQDDDAGSAHDAEEQEVVEKPLSLNEQRLETVIERLRSSGARRVVDLGCGSGKLVQRILRQTTVEKVLGVDVSHRALEGAARRLHLDTMAPRLRERVDLVQGALTYRDRWLEGFDAATVIEVIEHLDPGRLDAFERALFAHARPVSVIVTTPNVEYNVLFATLPAGSLRHKDHRFEWTRAEFAEWSDGVAARHGYSVERSGIGADDPERGAPTQMAVFQR
ncbi:MAG: 3' terminal RNA ribose 2'-O-methyltransferase Hen1 [Acidimicrobiales bacterium]